MTEPDEAPSATGLILPEYEPGAATGLTDAQRWPTLTDAGRDRLVALRDHPLAPTWLHTTGDRLTADMIAAATTPLPTAEWLVEHLAVARRLPFYRSAADPPTELADFPPIGRDELIDDISAFVPFDADLSDAIQTSSSGTTGRVVVVPENPVVVSRGFHTLHTLLTDHGVDWHPESDRMALAYVVRQRIAFTYASVISGFEQATMARINMHPAQWPPAAGHSLSGIARRNAFLLDQNPVVVSGTPTALAELLDADLVGGLHPRAFVSGGLALTAALRARLEDTYAVPVLDVYSLHETGLVATRFDDGPFVIPDRRILVEILDPVGRPVAAGSRGEIVVTAGENPLLPLVRYRTGDSGRLVEVDGRPAIADLEGRHEVLFTAADGAAVPSVDLTQLLQPTGALAWTVDQRADGTVHARIAGTRRAADRCRGVLAALLGRPIELHVVASVADLGDGKPRRYSSALPIPPAGRRAPIRS